jgi:porin
MIDQLIWRMPGDDPKKGVGVFALVSASPADRNLESFYAEGGITCVGILEKRPNDTFGVGVIYSPVSPSVRAFDAATDFFSGTPLPIRNYEMALEATYQAQVVPGWYIQPDFQYVFHPGYGGANPINPTLGRIPDAVVFAIRTGINF